MRALAKATIVTGAEKHSEGPNKEGKKAGQAAIQVWELFILIGTREENMDLVSDNITQKYSLDEEEKTDPATKEWCKLIDLDTVIKSELDWHSTRTFELFLDALDVNQSVTQQGDNNNKSKPKTDSRQQTITNELTSTAYESKQDKNVTDSKDQNESEKTIPSAIKNVDTYQGVETILSAEALKILSELPDLSHMSSTRSFIFPTNRQNIGGK